MCVWGKLGAEGTRRAGRACAGGELSVRIGRLGEGSGHPGPDPQSRRHWDAGHKLWTWHHVPGSPAQGMAPRPSRPPQAVEAAQLAEDLKVQLEHVQTRLREIQPCLAESRAAREKESFNLKRAQEDISRLRRKLEKQRKVEVYADADEILQEEIKEYKVRLWAERCPFSGGILDGGWWR